MAGDSHRSLVDKLGLKAGARACVLNAPDCYAALLGPLPEAVELVTVLEPDLDFIHAFAFERDWLEQHLQILRNSLRDSGMIWISWPKRASKVPTNLTDQVVRDHALSSGLVDVKVAALDEVWSGLKLVIPVSQRGRNGKSHTAPSAA